MSSPAPQATSAGPRRTVTVISAKQTVPFIYRFILLVFEPFVAVAGAFFTLRRPATYLATLTRELVPFREDTSFLYSQLSGRWLLVAFIELFILNNFDDRRLWRTLCLGMLLTDATYLHGCAQAVGGWASFVTVGNWTVNDWFVFVTALPPIVVRVLMVSSVGSGLQQAQVVLAKKDN